MGTLGLIVGSAGAGLCGMLFFMLTAFGGGGLVAPGRPPLSKAVERYLNGSLIAGPVACGLFALLGWVTGTGLWFAAPPALLAAHVFVIFRLYGRR